LKKIIKIESIIYLSAQLCKSIPNGKSSSKPIVSKEIATSQLNRILELNGKLTIKSKKEVQK
jgi:hypothetical protein